MHSHDYTDIFVVVSHFQAHLFFQVSSTSCPGATRCSWQACCVTARCGSKCFRLRSTEPLGRSIVAGWSTRWSRTFSRRRCRSRSLLRRRRRPPPLPPFRQVEPIQPVTGSTGSTNVAWAAPQDQSGNVRRHRCCHLSLAVSPQSKTFSRLLECVVRVAATRTA